MYTCDKSKTTKLYKRQKNWTLGEKLYTAHQKTVPKKRTYYCLISSDKAPYFLTNKCILSQMSYFKCCDKVV